MYDYTGEVDKCCLGKSSKELVKVWPVGPRIDIESGKPEFKQLFSHQEIEPNSFPFKYGLILMS